MKTQKKMPPLEYVMECVEVDFGKGKCFWKIRPNYHFNSIEAADRLNRKYAGKDVAPKAKTYTVISLGKYGRYPIHRIIYYLFHKTDPIGYEIDHKDGDKNNNNINNLRKATYSQNAMNRSGADPRNISTGILGVSLCNQTGLYKVRCTVNGKEIWGGRHKDINEAIKKSKELRSKVHGEFAGNVDHECI